MNERYVKLWIYALQRAYYANNSNLAIWERIADKFYFRACN